MQFSLSDRSRLCCDNRPADVQGADLRGDPVQHVVGDQGERVAAALSGPRHRIPPHVGALQFEPLRNKDVSQKIVLKSFLGSVELVTMVSEVRLQKDL